MELDNETIWNSRAIDTAQSFAVICRDLCDADPNKPVNPLTHIMHDTMTELWDHGFSQTEIRQEFLEAIDNLA